MPSVSEQPFRREHFERQDERDDTLFYSVARLETHIDDHAIAAVGKLYAELLPPDAEVLDFMSSWKSHMPEGLRLNRLTGLGLNEVELRENDQLDGWVVHDVNETVELPFAEGSFDAAVMCVSVQYLVHPVETFREVRRVLRPGGPFIVTYSNRPFPEKAVAIWWACSMEDRARLVGGYFHYAGGWEGLTAQDRSERREAGADPLFAVWARKAAD